MKKALLAILSALLVITTVQPSQAQDQNVLAIIDTAVDSNKVTSVIHEVCFTDSTSMACPDGKLFMDLKIVFVRIANITALGNSGVTTNTLTLGMDWVSKNATKYGIDAVSISQSSISKNNLDACTGIGTLKNEGILAINAVSALNASGVLVFAGTGNDSSKTVVGFPSCVNGAIGIGSIKPNLTDLSSFTNRGPGLDAVAQPTAKIKNFKGTEVEISGTSVSTALAAARYVKNKGSGTFVEFEKTFTKVLGYLYINK